MIRDAVETKTLILGIGNTVISDDGVGIRVAEECSRKFARPQLTVMGTDITGLSLLDLLIGYDRVIIVDAIQTAGGQPGRIYRLEPEMDHDSGCLALTHDVDLVTALQLGTSLGLAVPGKIIIFAIEVADVTTFSEECTPEVRLAIPVCVDMIAEELSYHN